MIMTGHIRLAAVVVSHLQRAGADITKLETISQQQGGQSAVEDIIARLSYDEQRVATLVHTSGTTRITEAQATMRFR
jgi:hypothetical protein